MPLVLLELTGNVEVSMEVINQDHTFFAGSCYIYYLHLYSSSVFKPMNKGVNTNWYVKLHKCIYLAIKLRFT